MPPPHPHNTPESVTPPPWLETFRRDGHGRPNFVEDQRHDEPIAEPSAAPASDQSHRVVTHAVTVGGNRCGETAGARSRCAVMKVLIIGGNRFLGVELTARLLARGDDVTLLNRGTLIDPFGAGVTRLRADRGTDEFDAALAGTHWDIVFDFALFDGAQTERLTASSTRSGCRRSMPPRRDTNWASVTHPSKPVSPN